jgi:hypothetical protein
MGGELGDEGPSALFDGFVEEVLEGSLEAKFVGDLLRFKVLKGHWGTVRASGSLYRVRMKRAKTLICFYLCPSVPICEPIRSWTSNFFRKGLKS